MEEIFGEEAELVARVAALDIGKATLTACVRVPHESKPGRRRQEVRTFATVTPSLLELRDWLTCQGVSLCVMEACRRSTRHPRKPAEVVDNNSKEGSLCSAGWDVTASPVVAQIRMICASTGTDRDRQGPAISSTAAVRATMTCPMATSYAYRMPGPQCWSSAAARERAYHAGWSHLRAAEDWRHRRKQHVRRHAWAVPGLVVAVAGLVMAAVGLRRRPAS